MKKIESEFIPTHVVTVAGWWHKFEKGTLVRKTERIGKSSGLFFYESEDGTTSVLDSEDSKQL